MITTAPHASALVAAILLALQLGLMVTVGRARGRLKQGIGDGGDPELALKIRRHGNLAENAAIFVVVLALLELLAVPTWQVLALGLTFVVARIAHAVGLSLDTKANPPRVVGALGTVLSGLVAAGYLAWTALSAL